MRLASEFLRLPLSFDVERLRTEALQFGEYDWDYHPQRYDGNTALSLISKDGTRSNSYTGAMQKTPMLERCPYIQQVMASFNAVLGRSRLMRIAPFKGVPPHCDTDYTWRNRVRIHIPIVTDPAIRFSSVGNIDVHMRAGEAWIFDNWHEHAVLNEANIHRIHLVIDTVGSAKFWALADAAWNPRSAKGNWEETVQFIDFDAHKETPLRLEKHNLLPVRSPAEVATMIREFTGELEYLKAEEMARFQAIRQVGQELVYDWQATWAEYWDSCSAIPIYQRLIQQAKQQFSTHLDGLVLGSNAVLAEPLISSWLDLLVDASQANSRQTLSSKQQSGAPDTPIRHTKVPTFEQPVFIVAAPRSGSTMLFEALKNNKDVWSIGDESHFEFESIAELHPQSKAWSSNSLDAADASPEVVAKLIDNFVFKLQNVRCQAYTGLPPELQPTRLRFLEKTPKNALRIPFLKAAFPDARFVFLYRQAEPNIGSIMDAWASNKFVTYRELAGAPEGNWSLLLNPGWQTVAHQPLAIRAAFQWAQTNQTIIHALQHIAADEWHAVSYEQLLADPGAQLEAICQFAKLPYGPRMQAYARDGFPHSKYVVNAPDRHKWRQHETEIRQAQSWFVDTQRALEQFLANKAA